MYLFNGILEPMKYYSMQSFPDVFEQGGSFLLNDYLRLMISGSILEEICSTPIVRVVHCNFYKTVCFIQENNECLGHELILN